MNSILAFLSWYLILTLLGWLTFPLAYRLFPALADRGYSLARTAGLLIWAYIFWLFTSLNLTENNKGGILFGLLVLVGLSGWSLVSSGQGSQIKDWLKSHLRLVLTTEVLFLLAFACLAVLRAGNPELDNAEKPMELMFINAILRSPTFPPHDGWLSGYAISYYYFGYVMAAMLAKLTDLTGSVAHNLMTSLIFGLAAVGAYGILYNLLALLHPKSNSENPRPSLLGPLLAPLFLLVVSNLEGFLEVLHSLGLFWSGTQNFWTWLGIQDINQPPTQPLTFVPSRWWWWWRASRVVSDFDLKGNFLEVIDEFPFFSFLHADLHPHVLAIPFNLLAVAVALNLFLGAWRGEINLLGLRLQISAPGFLFSALTLGGLAFLNTWDILVAASLIVAAYVLYRVRRDGWSWVRLEDVFALGLPLGFTAVLLYLPFYFGFSSQAGGILPDLINPTRGAQLWVMFAPLFIPLLAYLVYLWRGEKHAGKWRLAFALGIGLVLLLFAFSWLIGWLETWIDPLLVQQYLAVQGVPNVGGLFVQAVGRRLSYGGGLLTLLMILVPAVAFLVTTHGREATGEVPEKGGRATGTGSSEPGISNSSSLLPVDSSTFILLLITMGAVLVLAPDFVYLRDQFMTRLNTIFKFYYQAWLLWSLAAAYGVVVLLRRLRAGWDWAFSVGLAALLFCSLAYPVLGVYAKTNNLNPPLGWTLDDFARIQQGNPDEAAAIQWLRNASYGVVAEAVGGSYSAYARISIYSGLPTVLGWPGHESQWRGGSSEQGSRSADIAQLYTTSSWQNALAIITEYDIRYIYIGDLERSTYPVQEEKFKQHLTQVFQQGSVTIYEVK